MGLFIKQLFVYFSEETFNDIFGCDDIKIDDEIGHQCAFKQKKITNITTTDAIVEIFAT